MTSEFVYIMGEHNFVIFVELVNEARFNRIMELLIGMNKRIRVFYLRIELIMIADCGWMFVMKSLLSS